MVFIGLLFVLTVTEEILQKMLLFFVSEQASQGRTTLQMETLDLDLNFPSSNVLEQLLKKVFYYGFIILWMI